MAVVVRYSMTAGAHIRFGSKDILRCGNYSITSLARPSSGSGKVMPNALADLRLVIRLSLPAEPARQGCAHLRRLSSEIGQ
jgi:hypothetical protein